MSIRWRNILRCDALSCEVFDWYYDMTIQFPTALIRGAQDFRYVVALKNIDRIYWNGSKTSTTKQQCYYFIR